MTSLLCGKVNLSLSNSSFSNLSHQKYRTIMILLSYKIFLNLYKFGGSFLYIFIYLWQIYIRKIYYGELWAEKKNLRWFDANSCILALHFIKNGKSLARNGKSYVQKLADETPIKSITNDSSLMDAGEFSLNVAN